ncbi:Lsr2 family protein [Streptomyces sp. NPDC004528]|uniref:histone-like nucleoid-structuring protein Lsr2 n=1 Tax=Streptomyces sp. NPDC004528 TaxID=3154550 RepID=UPI0033A00F90
MAQKVQVTLVDDLDGSDADETVTFGLDGSTYEIDLTGANADRLRKALTPYREAGRRTGNRRGGKPAKRTQVGSDATTIRAWAKSNGWPNLSNRGRVPADVRDAFEAAHAGK